MSKRILTKTKFKKWLKSQHPRTKVGQPAVFHACPIAKFLLQSTGREYEVDDYTFYALDESTSKYSSLPIWASKFVTEVDNISARYVTANRALKCLSKVV